MFVPNSNFTAYYLKENWKIPDCKIKMTYHPVNLLTQTCKKEKGSILICSRIEKSKKIEELINAKDELLKYDNLELKNLIFYLIIVILLLQVQ